MAPLDRDRLRAQLVRHEAMKLTPYVDTAGKLTIGIGRNLSDVGISEDEAFFLASNDIDRAIRGLSARYPTWFPALDSVRQAVLVNMAFNLGLSGLAGFRLTLDAAARGDYATAADGMLDSKWAKQVGSRAVELSAQMRTGVWA
jgi:lysozyme